MCLKLHQIRGEYKTLVALLSNNTRTATVSLFIVTEITSLSVKHIYRITRIFNETKTPYDMNDHNTINDALIEFNKLIET